MKPWSLPFTGCVVTEEILFPWTNVLSYFPKSVTLYHISACKAFWINVLKACPPNPWMPLTLKGWQPELKGKIPLTAVGFAAAQQLPGQGHGRQCVNVRPGSQPWTCSKFSLASGSWGYNLFCYHTDDSPAQQLTENLHTWQIVAICWLRSSQRRPPVCLSSYSHPTLLPVSHYAQMDELHFSLFILVILTRCFICLTWFTNNSESILDVWYTLQSRNSVLGPCAEFA